MVDENVNAKTCGLVKFWRESTAVFFRCTIEEEELYHLRSRLTQAAGNKNDVSLY
jgi:hypothetical protein